MMYNHQHRINSNILLPPFHRQHIDTNTPPRSNVSSTTIHPLHKPRFDNPHKRRCGGMLGSKLDLHMNGIDVELLHVFGERDVRVEGTEGEVPGIQVVETGKIKSPITLLA